MDLASFFNPVSLTQPTSLGSLYWFWLITFIVILVVGIGLAVAAYFLRKANPYLRRILRAFYSWGISLGIIGVLNVLAQVPCFYSCRHNIKNRLNKY